MSSAASSQPTDPASARRALALRTRLLRGVVVVAAVMLAVVSVVTYGTDDLGAPLGPVVVIALIVSDAVALQVLGRTIRPLTAADTPALTVAVQRLSSLGVITITVAEVPVLIGFVLTVVLGGAAPALIGAAGSIALVMLLGPTATRVDGWIRRLESGGVPTGL